jgi:hypothetical protein
MGASFARLPTAVQRFHRLSGPRSLEGWVETRAPSSLLARLLAWCLGSPQKSIRGRIRFDLDAQPDAEVWVRHFPAKTMKSRLVRAGERVEEKLGASRLRFGLRATDAGLEMELEQLHFFGVPCPRWLLPTIVAQEHGDHDQIHFRVSASVPLIGIVASYQGHLVLEQEVRP